MKLAQQGSDTTGLTSEEFHVEGRCFTVWKGGGGGGSVMMQKHVNPKNLALWEEVEETFRLTLTLPCQIKNLISKKKICIHSSCSLFFNQASRGHRKTKKFQIGFKKGFK